MYYAGEQVYLSYGNKSNLNLLLWYGFVADIEQTKYYFQISPQAKNDIRYQLMSKLDSSNLVITLHEIKPELYTVGRILSISEDQLNNPAIVAALLHNKPLSDDIEIGTRRKLISLLTGASKSYSNIQQELMGMESDIISSRIVNILSLKIMEKQILELSLKKLQRELEDLKDKQEMERQSKRMFSV